MARRINSRSVVNHASTSHARSVKKTVLSANKRLMTKRTPSRSANDGRATAKLFCNGRSQAVRLPKEFRMPGTEVRIHREGDKLILEPVADVPRDAKGWPIGFWKHIHELTRDLPDDWVLPNDPVPPPITPMDALPR